MSTLIIDDELDQVPHIRGRSVVDEALVPFEERAFL